MPYNKIVFGGETKIDLTSDTVTASTLSKGITAHDKTGAIITGTLEGIPSNPFAAISVTYPQGWTLTCSEGSTTLTALNSIGKYTFFPEYAGTWVIEASNGVKEKISIVEVEENGAYSVVIKDALYIYTLGDTVLSTSSYISTMSSGQTIRFIYGCQNTDDGIKMATSNGSACFTTAINFMDIAAEGFTNLCIETQDLSSATDNFEWRFGVSTSQYVNQSSSSTLVAQTIAHARNTPTTDRKFTCDISGITGNKYVHLYAYGVSTNYCIQNVYFE